MSKVRVYQPASGPVRIVIPNEKLREDGESDADFVARIAALTEAADPTLQGLPAATIDKADLPVQRDRTNGQGEKENVRGAWRLVNGAVVIDPTKIGRLR